VQVGAIKVSRKNNAILEERLWYVLPELNKDLSEYFIELTGITQEKLMAEGTSFDSFNREFGKFVD
jgi:inhibitor of KinA sporulation pathway (predicted exonuclease)